MYMMHDKKESFTVSLTYSRQQMLVLICGIFILRVFLSVVDSWTAFAMQSNITVLTNQIAILYLIMQVAICSYRHSPSMIAWPHILLSTIKHVSLFLMWCTWIQSLLVYLPNLHCYTILTKFERVVIYHHCMSGFYLEIFVWGGGGGGGGGKCVKQLGVDHIHFSLNHTHLISVIDWGIMTSEELQVIIS